jgi:hypothetical protein
MGNNGGALFLNKHPKGVIPFGGICLTSRFESSDGVQIDV